MAPRKKPRAAPRATRGPFAEFIDELSRLALIGPDERAFLAKGLKSRAVRDFLAADDAPGSQAKPAAAAMAMIASGETPNFHAAANAAPKYRNERGARRTPSKCGRINSHPLANIIPATAAEAPTIAALTVGFLRHASYPQVISTAIAADGAVSARTPAIAPRHPATRAPSAAQKATTLVPGVIRASENAIA